MTKATIQIWNVELGLAIHIKSPNNKNIVIDLGSGYENRSPISSLTNERIHFLIITHPHRDHISDILNLDENNVSSLASARFINEDKIMKNVRSIDENIFKKYCDIVYRKFTDTETIVNSSDYPLNPENYGGLGLIYFEYNSVNEDNFNNFSLITVMKFGTMKVVICGDNEVTSLMTHMENSHFREAVKNSDILVAPHHGRQSAYLADFVNLVKPKLTIISDTSKTDASAVDLYSQHSSGLFINGLTRKCLTTRTDGNISITLNSENQSIDVTTSKYNQSKINRVLGYAVTKAIKKNPPFSS